MSEKQPTLADRLEALAFELKPGGEDALGSIELPWRAWLVISTCLRAYFDPEADPRCPVCDYMRVSALDGVIETLKDEMTRVSYVVADLEQFLLTEVGREIPEGEQIMRDRARAEALASRFAPPRRHRIPISAELRRLIEGG